MLSLRWATKLLRQWDHNHIKIYEKLERNMSKQWLLVFREIMHSFLFPFLWFLKFYNVHVSYSLIKIKINTYKRNGKLLLGFTLFLYLFLLPHRSSVFVFVFVFLTMEFLQQSVLPSLASPLHQPPPTVELLKKHCLSLTAEDPGTASLLHDV